MKSSFNHSLYSCIDSLKGILRRLNLLCRSVGWNLHETAELLVKVVERFEHITSTAHPSVGQDNRLNLRFGKQPNLCNGRTVDIIRYANGQDGARIGILGLVNYKLRVHTSRPQLSQQSCAERVPFESLLLIATIFLMLPLSLLIAAA